MKPHGGEPGYLQLLSFLGLIPHPLLSMEMLCSDLGWEPGVLVPWSVIQLCKCSLGLPAFVLDQSPHSACFWPRRTRTWLVLGIPYVHSNTDGIVSGELCDLCGWKDLLSFTPLAFRIWLGAPGSMVWTLVLACLCQTIYTPGNLT